MYRRVEGDIGEVVKDRLQSKAGLDRGVKASDLSTIASNVAPNFHYADTHSPIIIFGIQAARRASRVEPIGHCESARLMVVK